MALEITGKLIQKLELQSGVGRTGNSWQKQEFIIETMEQYPKKICANLWGDKVDNLSSINIGEVITISVSIESREFNGRWYTDVKTWKIERPAANPTQPVQTNTQPPQQGYVQGYTPSNNFPPVEPDTFVDEGAESDLPF